MDYEKLSDEQLQEKHDEAILKADPAKLTEEELDRRLYLAENRHSKPDMLQGTLDAAGDVLGMAGTVADYPMGIVRSAVDNVSDIFSQKKSPSEALSSIGDSFAGPSHAPTAQALAEKAGIPDTTIPGTDIPQSAAAGLGLDILMGIPVAKAANVGTKALAKGARNLLSADEMALKAVGMPSKQIDQAVSKGMLVSDGEKPLAELNKTSKYAQENVLKPMSSTEKVFKRASDKFREVGLKIGKIRSDNEKSVEQWLKKNPKSEEVAEYLNNTFQPKRVLDKVFAQIDQEVPSVKAAEAIKNLVTAELEPLHMKFNGREIPIEKLSDLKAYWQNEINFGKEAADYSVREAANDFLQRAANQSIDNEIKFGDKYLKGSDLAEHRKLKDEYGMLANMTTNLRKKLAKEIAAPGGMKLNPFTWELDPARNTRGQSTIASIPENPNPFGVKSQVTAGVGQAMNMRQDRYKEPMIEGFPVSQTQEVPVMQIPLIEKEISKSDVSNIQKAKQINLLRKHGRVLIGQ